MKGVELMLPHTHTPRAKEIISLSPPKTGKEIMEAVRRTQTLHTTYVQVILREENGVTLFTVGRRGTMPNQHFAIRVGGRLDELGLAEEKLYSTIAVCDHNWGGLIRTVGYTAEAYHTAVQRFALELTPHLGQ